MNKRWLAILLGAASAGLMGYGASRYLRVRKNVHKNRGPDEGLILEGDRPLSHSECPACGKPVKEYEFFCPYCGHSPEKDQE